MPTEADIDWAPGLLDGAMSLDLTLQRCNLEYWLGAVAAARAGLAHPRDILERPAGFPGHICVRAATGCR